MAPVISSHSADSASISISVAESQTFNHPYTPYDIQLQFMKNLYQCIQERKVAIFESPTGTGKSLSLICGALTWLRDHKRSAFLQSVHHDENDDGGVSVHNEPDWIVQASRREKRQRILEKRRILEERLARVRAQEARQKQEYQERENYPAAKKRRVTKSNDRQSENDEDAEAEFELDDYYDSDGEGHANAKGPLNSSKSEEILSSETRSLLEKLGGSPTTTLAEEQQPEADSETRIFYTSRTHSQLTQFAHELRRVKPPPSIPPEEEEEQGDATPGCKQEGLRHVPLGSRKQLCIYPPVSSLKNQAAINERCLELQRSKTTADKKCPHIPSDRNASLVNDFRDLTLAKVMDIEDIGTIGEKIGICPYYASRSVVPYSEITTLPYPLLLQRSAREALDIQLKDQVIIIDEAHNLTDAISNLFSVSISQTQLQTALEQLTTYARRYQKRLAGRNRVYITQVIRLVQSILAFTNKIAAHQGSPASAADGVCQPSDLMVGKAVDQINPHKLSKYLQESKLARKVDGYIDHTKKKEQQQQQQQQRHNETGNGRSGKPLSTPVLFQVHSFLLPLMNPSKEGKLFYERMGDDVVLKYMLLDPTNHFREIVEDARAVILAGGTMSPMSDYRDYLFSYLPEERLKTFSFGHVIPPENLIATVLSQGTLGTPFEFTFEKRGSESLIIDLGMTILHLCRQIPDGVVVFFPSYDYISRVLAVWNKCSTPGSRQTVLSQMQQCKPLFHEPQDRSGGEGGKGGTTAASSTDVLSSYSKSILQGKGALLLSVMGGKLSEGINFSDRLGRGVIVVGLPFPNIRSAVWKAKIEHVERKAYEKEGEKKCGESSSMMVMVRENNENVKRAKAKNAGREYYENACLRIVNQCIGRAIRHRDDYAAIVLLDRRYETKRIQQKLPMWIMKALVSGGRVSGISQELSRFFRREGLKV